MEWMNNHILFAARCHLQCCCSYRLLSATRLTNLSFPPLRAFFSKHFWCCIKNIL